MISIKHQFHIEASKKEVFEAISSISKLKQWWTAQITGSDKLNNIISFRFGDNGFIDFKVAESVPNTFYKWVCTNAHPEWIGTEATFTLSDNEGKTKITFDHSGWAAQSDFYSSCSFSWAKYFISLKNLCEGKGGNPYSE